MTVTRAQVIAAHRAYLGVAYREQGVDRNGFDCGQFPLRALKDLGLSELEFLGYSNSPDGETYERLLDENLDPIEPKEDVLPSDIVACEFGQGIQHIALVTTLEPRRTVIHARRIYGVVEQSLYGRFLRGWSKSYRIRGVVDD